MRENITERTKTKKARCVIVCVCVCVCVDSFLVEYRNGKMGVILLQKKNIE